MKRTFFTCMVDRGDLEGLPTLHLPVGAKFLHFGRPGAKAFWATFEIEDDDQAETERRDFGVYATNETLPPKGEATWLGTVMEGYSLFHLYELHDPDDIPTGN